MILEVLDKFPSPAQSLISGALLGALGFLACLRWPRFLWVALPFGGLMAWATVSSYTDPYVGPALWAEGGWAYAIVQGIGVGLIALPPVLGARLTIRHSRLTVPATSSHEPMSDLEAQRRRVNRAFDIADMIVMVLLPEWLWPTNADDGYRRIMAAFLLLLVVLGLVLFFGAWITGSFPFAAA